MLELFGIWFRERIAQLSFRMNPPHMNLVTPLSMFQTHQLKTGPTFSPMGVELFSLKTVVHVSGIRNDTPNNQVNRGINVKNINRRSYDFSSLVSCMEKKVLTVHHS